jgi:cation:H+ antiporter
MLNFVALGLWPNFAIFVIAALVVWIAGTRLAWYAKAISDRTGAEQAFIGILLLGAVVSLPEMATTAAASVLGDARLAVNTLLGGIAVVMVIVAVTDMVTGPEPLSVDISRPIVLFQGILVTQFMLIAAAGIVAGDVLVGGVGVWTSALFAMYLLYIVLVKRYGSREPWVAKEPAAAEARPGPVEITDRRPMTRIALLTLLASVAILVAGFLLAATGEVLGELTGLGSSFIGMALGGIATSLPEISTTVAAVRLRQYEMAFGDAFGTNLFSTMLLFVADVAYAGGPILNEVGAFSLFATLLGIFMTTVYLAGFVERSRRSMLRMGIDSVIVLLVYAAGMFMLFHLR